MADNSVKTSPRGTETAWMRKASGVKLARARSSILMSPSQVSQAVMTRRLQGAFVSLDIKGDFHLNSKID